MTTATVRLGRLEVGKIPRVIGTISQPATLQTFRELADVPCDIVEVRLDLIGPDLTGWLDHCEAIEARGFPVLLTIRLKTEGGHWTRPDAERLELFDLAVLRLSALDIELQ